MKKNIRVLIVCENKKQTEKLFEVMEKNPNGAYVDTCYHYDEKAVMIETESDDENFLAISVAAANNVAKENGVNIKHFIFESGW